MRCIFTSTTLLFGGSFDPIHNGHISLLNKAIEFTKSDVSIVMPAAVSPFKTSSTLTTFEDRINMCVLATKNISNIIVSDLEIHLPKPSYTYNTITELSKTTNNNITMLCGSDSLLQFDNWYRWQDLLNLINICVAVRSTDDTNKLNEMIKSLISKGGKITTFPFTPINISSSEIRLKIRNNESITGLVSPEVEEYIYSHKLYL